MKQIFKRTLVTVLMLVTIIPLSIFATNENEVYIVTTRQDLPEEPEAPIDPGLKGHRSPARKIPIVISHSEGVIIPEIGEVPIISYEVLNGDGDYIGIFNTGIEFANFVLSQTEIVEIRIIFDEFMLCGFVCL